MSAIRIIVFIRYFAYAYYENIHMERKLKTSLL